MTAPEREEKAVEYFMAGYNCCQSVVLAFSDVIGIDEESLKKISSGFGGGVGRMREVCGAVSGMVMAAGFLKPAGDPSDHAARTANYALVQNLAAGFRERKGSIICRELLSLRQADTSPEPSERTAAYYHSRPCASCVATAARLVAELL